MTAQENESATGEGTTSAARRFAKTLLRLSDDAWSYLSDGRRLFWLWSSLVLSLAFGVAARGARVAGFLETVHGRGALGERVYVFFDLHDPIASWWFAALLALCSVTTIAAGFCRLGEELAVRRSSKLSLAAIFVVTVGAVFLLTGGVVERRASLSGEVLLQPGHKMDRVALRAAPGRHRHRQMPMPLELIEADTISATVLVLGVAPTAAARAGCEPAAAAPLAGRDEAFSCRLEKGRISSLDGVLFNLRALLPLPGKEVLVLAVQDRATGEVIERELVVGQRLSVPGDGGGYLLLEQSLDFRGLGRAARLLPLPAGQEQGKPSAPFWVFERFPTFDALNRQGQQSLALLRVDERRGAVVAVSRHPGMGLGAIGAILLILGFIVMVLRRLARL